jgi:flagellin
MTMINTNISALRAQNGARTAEAGLSRAMERLSSGLRINSAKDDAAGLAIFPWRKRQKGRSRK